MNIVLFHSDEIDSLLPLADQRVQHLQRILRKEVGDTFEAGIINGPSGVAQITAWNEEGLSFEFTPTGNGKPLYPLTMIIGFPRPIQLKRLLRDIASLGFQFGVGIGIGLKVSQKLHVGVFTGKELLTFFQLLGHTLFRLAIRRIERLVVAIRTSTISHRTVPVRTSEASIQGNLLHLIREMCRQVGRKVIVSDIIHFHNAKIDKSEQMFYLCLQLKFKDQLIT